MVVSISMEQLQEDRGTYDEIYSLARPNVSNLYLHGQ